MMQSNTSLFRMINYSNPVHKNPAMRKSEKVPQTSFPNDYPNCGMTWVVNPFEFNETLSIQELDDMDSTRWNIPLHIAVMQHCIF